MKTKRFVSLLVLCALGLAAPAAAADGPGHVHADKPAAPNGGRVLTEVEPHAELLVTAERKLKLTFLDAAGKPVPPPAGATASAATGDRSAPTNLAFAAEGGALVSTATLPEGQNLPAVLRIKPGAEAKTVTVRVQINLAKCGECGRPEYACTCGH